jgi:hypothetical protein
MENGMRRVSLALTILVSLSLLVEPTVASASTDRITGNLWRGVTEQGGSLKMHIYRTEPGGPRVITLWTYTITYYCEHGSEFTSPFSMGGWNFPIVDGYGAFRFGAIIWKGNFSHDQARGTVEYANGHSNCYSGVVTWTAEHLHPPG